MSSVCREFVHVDLPSANGDRPFAQRSDVGRALQAGYRLLCANVVDDGETIKPLPNRNGVSPQSERADA